MQPHDPGSLPQAALGSEEGELRQAEMAIRLFCAKNSKTVEFPAGIPHHLVPYQITISGRFTREPALAYLETVCRPRLRDLSSHSKMPLKMCVENVKVSPGDLEELIAFLVQHTYVFVDGELRNSSNSSFLQLHDVFVGDTHVPAAAMNVRDLYECALRMNVDKAFDLNYRRAADALTELGGRICEVLSLEHLEIVLRMWCRCILAPRRNQRSMALEGELLHHTYNAMKGLPAGDLTLRNMQARLHAFFRDTMTREEAHPLILKLKDAAGGNFFDTSDLLQML